MSLLANPAATVMDVMGQVGTELFAHIGKAPQEDDITMLALRRKTPG
jgi:serine phosphatase RsbU (regulator of sigma subunit)